MPNVKNIIKDLEELDLSSYPYYPIQEQIRSLGRTGFLIFALHKNMKITRARPGQNYKEKSEVSFLPQEKNTKCQRASTPLKTMFYGTIIHEEQGSEESRLIAASEVSSLLKGGKETKGTELITFSNWRVIRDINLVVILDENTYKNVSNNPLLSELRNSYIEFVKLTPEIEENVRLISNFFAKEFAKEPINYEYDYFISAIFSEIVTNELNYDGVMYPSVQAGGQLGFNVAIKPEVVNKNLKLEKVGESTLYKNGELALNVIDKISELNNWEFYDSSQMTKELISQKIQIENLEELKND